MSDTKAFEEKIDQLIGMCAALTAFVCELPEAKTVRVTMFNKKARERYMQVLTFFLKVARCGQRI